VRATPVSHASAAPTLAVLSAGAAKGVVDAMTPRFAQAEGASIAGAFGAVGTIRERFLAGEACDVLILTDAMLDELARTGSVMPDTRAGLGDVPTGIAVRHGEPHPAIGDANALRAGLARSSEWYCPDTTRATAGIHFLRAVRDLGLDALAADRIRSYPSGAIAMQALARAGAAGALGCTQVTEILYTPGVDLVGVLPAPFALATPYGVAVNARAPYPELARRFARLLSGEHSREVRTRGGFIATA
jgi:molybdate transport system substrate-binding protein